MAITNSNPDHQEKKASPFARYLKGLFFFLVVVIVVSQLSPLILLERLIRREDDRAVDRLHEAIADIQQKWVAAPPDKRLALDLSSAAAQNGLRELRVAAFDRNDAAGRWLLGIFRPENVTRARWDTLSGTPPEVVFESDLNLRALSVAETWSNQPVVVTVAASSPIVASLRREMRSELWLRGVVLVSFLLFTLLFYRSVLLPFHDMRKRATALVQTGLLPPGPGRKDQDPEYVMATFDLLVQRLLKQAGLLEARAEYSERHARNLERFNDYILSSLTTGVVILDRQGEILRFNRAAEQILRLPAAAMAGRHFAKAGLPEPLVRVLEIGLHEGKVYSRRELKVERHSGPEPLYLGVNTSCIRNDGGDVVGLSMLLTDLTEIKKLQDDLTENQRLADLGEMAAGLAHQLRNSIAAIFGYARLLRKASPDTGPLSEWADGMIQETDETSALVTRFLEFARPLKSERLPVSLPAVIADAVQALQSTADQRQARIIEPIVHPRRPQEEPIILGEELLLKQMFINLIQNAVDASPPGAEVMVTIDETAPHPGAHLWMVTISDHGPGIAEEDRVRIFHPFFTTKEAGTGLGLPLARKIAVFHGGTLTLQRSGPGGSVFLVTLPAAPASGAPAPQASVAAVPQG